jgi:hypothetical protein
MTLKAVSSRELTHYRDGGRVGKKLGIGYNDRPFPRMRL